MSATGLDGLRDVHAQARLRPYLQGLWDRRAYLWYVSVNELKGRQMATVLGNFWHLLNPMLSIFVYWLIFGKFLDTSRGVDNFILFLTVGVFIFAYTQRATMAGAQSVVGNLGLLKSISFPRALLPVSSTLTEALATVPTIFVMYGVAIVTGEPIRWQWVLIIPILAGQTLFNVGAALIAARITHHVRDFSQVLPFIFRLLLYGSGVIFSVEAYAGSKTAEQLFALNPIYGYITLSRTTVLGGTFDRQLALITAIWSIVLFVGGFWWFRQEEALYGRD